MLLSKETFFNAINESKTRVLGFGALLFLVVLSLISPEAKVSGAWWVVMLAAWLLSPPKEEEEHAAPERLDWAPVQAMAFPVFAWLFFQVQLFALDALRTWTVLEHSPQLRLLAIPLQVTLSAILATALLSAPLHRLYGSKSSVAAGLVVLPYFFWAVAKIFLARQGSNHLVRDLVLLYNASMPCLLMLGTQALLVRSDRSNPGRLARWQKTLKVFSTGEASLRKTFFMVFLPVLILSLLALKARFMGDLLTGLPAELSAGISALVPLSTLILTAAAVVLWRAMHRARKTPVSPMFVGLAASLGLAPLWIWTMTIDGPLAEAYLREAVQRLPGPAYEVACSSGRKAIRVLGEYQTGMSRAFEEELARCPEAQVVQLGGPGGKLAEGIALAKAIQANGLSTIVPEVCVSACTVAFLAGKHRVILTDQALGFHSVLSPSIVGADHRSYSEFMAKQGVPEWFVQRAVETPNYTVWYPSNEELMRAGVITHLVTNTDPNEKGVLQARKTTTTN